MPQRHWPKKGKEKECYNVICFYDHAFTGTEDVDADEMREIAAWSEAKHHEVLCVRLSRATGGWIIHGELGGIRVVTNSCEIEDKLYPHDREIPAAHTLGPQGSVDYRAQSGPPIFVDKDGDGNPLSEPYYRNQYFESSSERDGRRYNEHYAGR